jgi:hypothetical protein
MRKKRKMFAACARYITDRRARLECRVMIVPIDCRRAADAQIVILVFACGVFVMDNDPIEPLARQIVARC